MTYDFIRYEKLKTQPQDRILFLEKGNDEFKTCIHQLTETIEEYFHYIGIENFQLQFKVIIMCTAGDKWRKITKMY